MKDELGDRMKGYELRSRSYLPRRTNNIIRLILISLLITLGCSSPYSTKKYYNKNNNHYVVDLDSSGYLIKTTNYKTTSLYYYESSITFKDSAVYANNINLLDSGYVIVDEVINNFDTILFDYYQTFFKPDTSILIGIDMVSTYYSCNYLNKKDGTIFSSEYAKNIKFNKLKFYFDKKLNMLPQKEYTKYSEWERTNLEYLEYENIELKLIIEYYYGDYGRIKIWLDHK